ncbi:hypothetical protein GCM10007857_47990 [Bradyrhizobium iriomotense]|uniref:Cation/H+ exchanger transmembrane domain-containing protein n=2 Tax=Bradyrhizobium iriomotense TaxID=441950 RepID=A0ABQ6B0X4_9BRAD|nr:hypothetical protein GCM10007857_47990 [Bradyrhizobium iriomotense]
MAQTQTGPLPSWNEGPAKASIIDFVARVTESRKSLFIPIFFVVTGFLINPVSFVYGIFDNFLLVASIIGALLVGKWIAAWVVGRAFGYNRNEQLTIWSLTLPHVAATLAATLVAHETLGAAGQRLLDDRMLNVVLVLVFATSVLGPVLTERFASRLTTGTRAELDR